MQYFLIIHIDLLKLFIFQLFNNPDLSPEKMIYATYYNI